MRLYVEYFLIAIILIVSGVAITSKFDLLRHEHQIEAMKFQIIEMETESLRKSRAISLLEKLRDEDGEVSKKLNEGLDKLFESNRSFKNRLYNLEKNEDVKNVLDYPIPPSISCLYSDTCEGESGSVESSKQLN